MIIFLVAYLRSIGRSRYEVISVAGVYLMMGGVAPVRGAPFALRRAGGADRRRTGDGVGAAVHLAGVRCPRAAARPRTVRAVERGLRHISPPGRGRRRRGRVTQKPSLTRLLPIGPERRYGGEFGPQLY